MTSSRQSARPIATRSEIWRTFEIRVPAARTVADRSASKRRAIVRAGGGPMRRAAGRVSTVIAGNSRSDRSWRGGCRSARPARRGPCIVAQAGPCEHGSAGTLATMTSSAFVFPGQGSQSVGMGQALAAASPAAAAVLAAADAALGEPISALAADGPADLLDRTENAQPALLAVSIAYPRRRPRALGRRSASRPRRRPSPPVTRWASTRPSSPPR